MTQSRLILLDSPLIFFTALTALSFTCFTNQHEQGPSKAFRGLWWFWLVTTGVCLGATVSVKWVGLFTIAWVGSLTVLQLWVLLGDANTVTPVCALSLFVLFLYTKLITHYVASMVQALLCPSVLSYYHSCRLLCWNVCDSLHLPCQSRRW